MRAVRRMLAAAWVVALGPLVACEGSTVVEPPSRADRMAASVEGGLGADPLFDAVRAVLVVADGRSMVRHLAGASPDAYHPVMSVTKSVLSLLVGVAVDDGLLALDDTVAEMLPRYADRAPPRVASVTLRDLLTMRGGFAEEAALGIELASAPDAVAAALATGRGAGGDFVYSDAGAHLVAAALTEATDRSVLEFARTVLFDPLGTDTEPAFQSLGVPANIPEYVAADFAWPVDRQGINLGGSGLKLRPADMLALGGLVLDNGAWEGHQVVPSAWLEEATSRLVEVDDTDSCGYLWWRTVVAGRDAVAALGYGGQTVVVVPDLALVAVTVTALDENLSSSITAHNMLVLLGSAISAGYGRQ